MAHGILPPFSDFLYSRDLMRTMLEGGEPGADLVLLGNAFNELRIPFVVATPFYSLLYQVKKALERSGLDAKRMEELDNSLEGRRFHTLLIAYVLDIEGAEPLLGSIAPSVFEEGAMWRTAIGGSLDQRILSVEDRVGALIKAIAKDASLQKPVPHVSEKLERFLGSYSQ